MCHLQSGNIFNFFASIWLSIIYNNKKKLFSPRNDWHKRSPAASTLQLKSCHSSFLTYSEHTVTKHVQVLEDARLNGFSPSVHPEYQVSVRLGLLAAGRTDGRTDSGHAATIGMEQCDRFLNKSCMDGRTVGRSVELPVRWSIDWSHKYMSKLLPDHQIQSNKPNQNGLLNQKAQSLDSNGQTSTTTPTTLGQLNEWQWLWLWMLWRKDGRTDRQSPDYWT